MTKDNVTDQRSNSKGTAAALRTKGTGKAPSVYKSVIGKTVLIPASVFGVDVPELWYKARVVKKDPSHTRAVVLRTSEDGNLFWLPVEQVMKWLREMEESGLTSTGCTIGNAASVYAAQVLTDFSRPAEERVAAPRTPSRESCAVPALQMPVSPLSVSSQRSSMTQADSASDVEDCSEALSSLKMARRNSK
ncbi:g3542 [Coccomyxa elongata]